MNNIFSILNFCYFLVILCTTGLIAVEVSGIPLAGLMGFMVLMMLSGTLFVMLWLGFLYLVEKIEDLL